MSFRGFQLLEGYPQFPQSRRVYGLDFGREAWPFIADGSLPLAVPARAVLRWVVLLAESLSREWQGFALSDCQPGVVRTFQHQIADKPRRHPRDRKVTY